LDYFFYRAGIFSDFYASYLLKSISVVLSDHRTNSVTGRRIEMKPALSVVLLLILIPFLFPIHSVNATSDFSKSEPDSKIARTSDTVPKDATVDKDLGHSVLSKLPLDFIENRGQWNKPVKFAARKGLAVVSFEGNAIKFNSGDEQRAGLALTFEGAANNVALAGEGKRTGHYNFFLGSDPKKWQSRAAVYESLLYRGLYSGIDMRVREEAGKLEYDLILAPFADLKRVVVRADGASKIEIAANGSLILQTAQGEFRQTPPVTWEESPAGEKRLVECRFRKIDSRRYGFEAPRRDATSKLVIDPGLEWGTFLGGSGHDTIDSIALAKDGSGDIILAGFTRSADFPVTNGHIGPLGQAPFLTRINSTGTALVYSTMFGGSGVDSALALAVDASSAPVVVGNTSSADFPVTTGAYDTTYNGDYDAFVARFDPSGGQLVFATYLGGSRSNPSNPTQGYEEAWGVGFDASGNIIVAGNTTSLNFPTTAGAYDTIASPYMDANFDSMQDSFVARLNPTGTTLTYSTYLGGQGIDYASDMVVDSQGFVTVAGRTVPVTNRDANGNDIPLGTPFPTTADAFDRTLNGNADVYVARLKLDGAGASDLKYSTLIGGNDTEQATAIALDPNNQGSVTVVGWTYSGNYPTTPGVIGTTHFSPLDTTMAFVTRLQFPAASGGSISWSTFYGAPGNQQADDVAIDSTGAAIVVGASGTLNPPTTERAYDRTPASSDAFLCRISPTGSQLLYSTLLGGSSFEGRSCVVYAGGNAVIVAGQTKSPDFPTTPGAYDRVFGVTGNPSDFGVYDVFVARMSLEPLQTDDTTASPPTLASPASGATFTTPAFVNFDWSDVADASGVEAYHLQVSPNSNFTDTIIAQLNGWYETWVTASEAAIDFPTGTFFWRVRTLDSSHNLSAWSAVQSFTVGRPVPPPAPTLLSPANDARLAQPIRFDWSDVNAAASYTIQVDDSSSFSSLVLNQTVSASEFIANSLPVTTVWWRVRANNSAGTPGAWSSVRRLRVTSGPAPPPQAVTLSTLSLNPATVTGGNSSQGTVTLTGAAPSGGAVVTLSSSNATVAAVPASVTVAAGATSASFTVTTGSVGASTPVTISATFGVSRTATLTVSPAASTVTLSSVALSPTSVVGGNSSQGTVTLTGAAPAGGVVVTLASSNTSAASVPANVTVPSGSGSATFTVTTRAVASSTAVTISATSGGTTRTATLTVTAAAPSTDTVAIQRAEYSSGSRVLRVEATSSSSSATLTVHVASTDQLIGTLRNEGGGRYRGDLSWPSNPQTIRVRSSLGGSATRAVTSK
jgi:hypothetical protein